MASAATVTTPNNTTNAILISESTNININGTSIPVAVAPVPDKKTCGTGYTKVEDLLIYKAFISASEDDIVACLKRQTIPSQDAFHVNETFGGATQNGPNELSRCIL
jgi:hypothetical protein